MGGREAAANLACDQHLSPEGISLMSEWCMTSAEDAPRSWSRLVGVDLLRGLAILFVLMNHVNMRLLLADVPYTRGLPEQLVSSLVWNGPARRPDFLRGFRVPDHIDHAPPLAVTAECQR